MEDLGIAIPPVKRKRSGLVWWFIGLGLFLLLILMVALLRMSAAIYYIPSAAMKPTLLSNDRILVNKLTYLRFDPKRGDVVVFLAPPEAMKGKSVFVERVIAVPGDVVHITAGYIMIGKERYGHNELRQILGSESNDCSIMLKEDTALVDGKTINPKEIASAAGEPNSNVRVVPGKVFLNGKPLNEPYIAEDSELAYPTSPMCSVKSDWIVNDKNGNREVRIPKDRLLVMGDNRNNSFDSRFWGLLEKKRVIEKLRR